MNPAINKRRLLLGAALALTLAAVAWASLTEEPQGAATVAAARAEVTPRAGETGMSLFDARRVEELRQVSADARPAGNAFAAKSFYVAPPSPKAAPPPPPSAPPLPFTYLGRMQESGSQLVVFLARGERLYSVRIGDVIDGAYRVDEFTSEEVRFMYLPMNERQTLRFAEAS